MKLSHPGGMIVRPDTLETEEKDMDEDNSAQQVAGQVVDTGPMPLDVLEARMTLTERDVLDRLEQLRRELAEMAPNASPSRLLNVAQSIALVNARLDMLRTLRDGSW